MNSNPFDDTLEDFHSKGTEAAIILNDGSQMKGRVKRFDGYVVFLENDVDVMVYRHSILKLSEAAALERAERQPQPKTERGTAPAPKPRPKTPPRQKRPPRKEQSFTAPQKEPGGMSRMGEELLKWLKNQKGNE